MKVNYKDIFKYIWKTLGKDKKTFIFSILLTFIKTIFTIATAIGIGVILQNFFTNIASADKTFAFQELMKLIFFSGIIAIGYLIYIVCYIYATRMIIKISFGIGYTFRELFFMKIHKAPFNIIQKQYNGDLITKGTTEINALSNNMSLIMGTTFAAPAIIIGVFIGLFFLSPYLTLITIALFLTSVFISYIFSKKAGPKYMKLQHNIGDLNAYIEESINNRKITKLFNFQSIANKQYSNLNEKYVNNSIKAEVTAGYIWPISVAIEYFLYAFLTVVGILFNIYDVNSGSIFFPKIEIGILTSFVLLARNATGEATNALRAVNIIQKIVVSTVRIKSVIDFPNYIDCGEKKVILKGDIEFKNVFFSYDEKKEILKDISLKIKANTTNAFVGPTGSGKTTIINLLSRFYEINKGEILIDGINIKDIKQTNLCKNISVVLQDSFLFSVSIKENIKYGNKKISDKEIIDICKKINIHDTIMKLPQKYETIIDDNKISLSHGQKQLISIARAAVSDANILILDEATASVDSKTEMDIQKAFKEISKNKTVITIAHRLSTIVNSDKIIVINNGEIIETGNHNELIKNKKFYYKLYKANESVM